MGLNRAELVDQVAENSRDVIFEDELFLVDALEQAAAQAIDGLALLVHDIVVFEQVLAGLEVLRFDRLLRGLDALGDHARLDGNALLHAEALEQVGDPLLGEDAHQVVFQREIKARGAGIALAAGASAELVVDAAGLVALGAEDVQAAGGDHFLMFGVGLGLVAVEHFQPVVGRDNVLVAAVVPLGHVGIVDTGLHFALRRTQRLGRSLLHAFLLGHEFGIAPKQDVGAAAGHIGGDGNRAFASSLSDDLGLALVVLGVQNDVLDAFFLEKLRKPLGFLDGGRAYQHRLIPFVEALNFIGRREVLFFLRAINHVGMLDAEQRLVGRNDHDLELVDLVELGSFRFSRTRHAGQLLVHAEVILEGNGGEGLVLALDLDAFLGFDRLVQTVRPAATGHHAPGELVNDDDLLLAGIVFLRLDDVLDVATVERVRFDGSFHVVLQVPVLGVGNVADAEQLFDLLPAFVGDRDVLVLFVDHEVAGVDLGFAGRHGDLFALLELGDDAVDTLVLVGGLFAGARDDERSAGFVDQDGVDLVDDGVVVHALHAVLEVELHVVAQVVEAKLVVGAVGDVGGVGFAALVIVEIVHDHADRQAEEAVELAHPLGVALGQVVVDRDHVDTAPAERVEVDREGGDQGLAFTGLHFRDLARVQHHPADQLHIEMTHVEDAAAGFAADGEGFDEQLVEDFFQGEVAFGFDLLLAVGVGVRLVGDFGEPLLDALAELVGLGAQLGVGKLLHGRLQSADGFDRRQQALHFALVFGAEHLGN